MPIRRKWIATVALNISFAHPWFVKNRMSGGPPIPTPAHITPLANPKPNDAMASLLMGMQYPINKMTEKRIEIMAIERLVIDDATL